MNAAVETLFDSLATEADLDRLCQAHREESVYLEFKRKRDTREPDLHDDDRKNFSKALSGFANAAGGILIFGIETRPADGIDHAHALAPIQQHQRFRANLMDSVVDSTHPPVDDVRIEAVPAAQGEQGYVKCLIPPSVKPPHRAMRADREYYVRMSDRQRRMEHYELEDVFGRRLRPSLRLTVELRGRAGEDPFEELHFAFLNEGRGIAKHSGLVCVIEGATIADTVHLQNQSHLNPGVQTVMYYNALSVIHANGLFSTLGHAIVTRPNRGEPLAIQVIWYAEDMQTRKRNLQVTPGPRVFV